MAWVRTFWVANPITRPENEPMVNAAVVLTLKIEVRTDNKIAMPPILVKVLKEPAVPLSETSKVTLNTASAIENMIWKPKPITRTLCM